MLQEKTRGAQPGKAALPPPKSGSAGFQACTEEEKLLITRRNLPHWQFPGSTYFVTFSLKSGILSENERKIVLDAIKHFHKVRYWITFAVVMPNHVHILLKPVVSESGADFSLSKIMQGIKGFSAREINKSRGAKGPLWIQESYDRIVRDHDEYIEKWAYIRDNPTRAELSQEPEEYAFFWEPGEPDE
jgi:REP element-mobilizing transposase RayT